MTYHFVILTLQTCNYNIKNSKLYVFNSVMCQIFFSFRNDDKPHDKLLHVLGLKACCMYEKKTSCECLCLICECVYSTNVDHHLDL